MKTILKVLYSVLLGLAGAVGSAGVQYLDTQAVELTDAGIVGLIVLVAARGLGWLVTKIPTRASLGLLALVLVGAGCTNASASPSALVRVIQQGDSLGWIITVTPVLDRRGNPVAGYVREVRDALSNALVVRDSTPASQLADTLWEASPLPGDSVMRTSRAAARDDRGTLGRWGTGVPPVITVFVPDTLGPPPPGVTFDTTTTALIIDRLQIDTAGAVAFSGIQPVGCWGSVRFCQSVQVVSWPLLRWDTLVLRQGDFAVQFPSRGLLASQGLDTTHVLLAFEPIAP